MRLPRISRHPETPPSGIMEQRGLGDGIAKAPCNAARDPLVAPPTNRTAQESGAGTAPPKATLTPAEAPHGVREAVVLVDLTLAWVLINDAQVLVPVRPVHLVHPGREKQFGGSLLLHE